MNLTTKGRYAVMAMVDIAVYQKNRPIALASIAERQSIAPNYLEQLFAKLRKAGLVSSIRGPGGGYVLARDAKDISILDIVEAADEPMRMTRCESESGQGCLHDKSRCLTHHLWADLSAHINRYLDAISLADLYNNKNVSSLLIHQVTHNNHEYAQ